MGEQGALFLEPPPLNLKKVAVDTSFQDLDHSQYSADKLSKELGSPLPLKDMTSNESAQAFLRFKSLQQQEDYSLMMGNNDDDDDDADPLSFMKMDHQPIRGSSLSSFGNFDPIDYSEFGMEFEVMQDFLST